MNNREHIVEKIKDCGGIYGHVAANYIITPLAADQLIEQCFEQCHTAMAQEIWGNELIAEIIQYRLELLRNAFAEVFGLDLTKPTWLRLRDNYFT